LADQPERPYWKLGWRQGRLRQIADLPTVVASRRLPELLDSDSLLGGKQGNGASPRTLTEEALRRAFDKIGCDVRHTPDGHEVDLGPGEPAVSVSVGDHAVTCAWELFPYRDEVPFTPALEQWVLRVAGSLRLVQGFARPYRLGVTLPAPPEAAELSHALAALRVAGKRCLPVAEALLDPIIAGYYRRGVGGKVSSSLRADRPF